MFRKTQWNCRKTIEIFTEASTGWEIIIRDDEDVSPDLAILPPRADIRMEVSCPAATSESAGTSSVTLGVLSPPPPVQELNVNLSGEKMKVV